MPLAGTPNVSIYPGDLGILMGTPTIKGTPITAGPEVLPAGDYSRTIVIAAAAFGHPVSQRQLVWRAFVEAGSGTLELLGSTDGVVFETVLEKFTVTGAGNYETNVQADGASGTDGGSPPGTSGVLSSYRFLCIKNTGEASITLQSDVTSL
jgi:hypothetical protein